MFHAHWLDSFRRWATNIPGVDFPWPNWLHATGMLCCTGQGSALLTLSVCHSGWNLSFETPQFLVMKCRWLLKGSKGSWRETTKAKLWRVRSLLNPDVSMAHSPCVGADPDVIFSLFHQPNFHSTHIKEHWNIFLSISFSSLDFPQNKHSSYSLYWDGEFTVGRRKKKNSYNTCRTFEKIKYLCGLSVWKRSVFLCLKKSLQSQRMKCFLVVVFLYVCFFMYR